MLIDCALETARTTGMIFLILIGAALFNYFIEISGLPRLLVDWVEHAGLTPFAVLLLIMLFYVSTWCWAASWTRCR